LSLHIFNSQTPQSIPQGAAKLILSFVIVEIPFPVVYENADDVSNFIIYLTF